MSPKLPNQRLFVTLILLSLAIPYGQASSADDEQPPYLQTAVGLATGAALSKAVQNRAAKNWVPASGIGKLTSLVSEVDPLAKPACCGRMQTKMVPRDKRLLRSEVPLTTERIDEILRATEEIKGNKISIMSFGVQNALFTTTIGVKYGARNEISNIEEIMSTLQSKKKTGSKIKLVVVHNSPNSEGYAFAAPAVLKNPELVETAEYLHRGLSALIAIPLVAVAVDAVADARGVPHSRQGYVADHFQKYITDPLASLLGGDQSGAKETGRNAAN